MKYTIISAVALLSISLCQVITDENNLSYAVPKECEQSNHPHDENCLVTLWESTGCSNTGQKSPMLLSSSDLSKIQNLPLE